jgi:hypothetical protein
VAKPILYEGRVRVVRAGAGASASATARAYRTHPAATQRHGARPKAKNKALNKGATYRICMVCYFELRAEEEEEVWTRPPACPSAAAGDSDCLCWCEPKQAAQVKRRKSTISSLKQQKYNASHGRSVR